MVILDSSIFVDNLRTNCHAARMHGLDDLARTSSVVLSELWRGVATQADERFLRRLESNYPILTPTEKCWVESGQVLGKMRADKGFEGGKLRDLHFDVLIALTARAHGAKLITSNRDDFELIQSYRDFKLEVW